VPELPEVEALSRFLAERAVGCTVERVEVAALSALKTYRPPVSELLGARVEQVGRRGKYLCVRTGPHWLVVHFSRAGWLRWYDSTPAATARPGRGPLALRVGLSVGGFDLTEAGTEKRLAVWVVADPAEVAGLARLGSDPLAADFDLEALERALSGQRGHLKTVLVDQSVLAGIGNAYSDEILHAARLSPFAAADRLDADQLVALHSSIRRVLSDAVGRCAAVPVAGSKGEKRSGLAVHGRRGEACPTCGTTIEEVAYTTRCLQYCPTCQTGGRVLADRRLSRLLR